MIAALASVSSSCIRVVSPPISVRCSSLISSTASKALSASAFGAHFERDSLTGFHVRAPLLAGEKSICATI